MSMILVERRGAVLVVTLNDPRTMNAMSEGLLKELLEALLVADSDPAVRAIVITGSGRGFCSGASLAGDVFQKGESIGPFMREGVNRIVETIRASSKPFITAVNGPAAGAGVGLALAGDIVLAAPEALFLLSFVRLGAALDAGTSAFLQRSIGAPRARALALLGKPLDAETAERWGLIWRMTPREALLSEALAIAEQLAAGPPVSIGLMKAQLDTGWSSPLSSVLGAEAHAQTQAFASQDLQEGAAAFAQKRSPRFNGR